MRNAAPCALASPSVCGARVLVALAPIDIIQDFRPRHMRRGDIAVFRWYDSYGPPTSGEFVEVSIKEEHPRVDTPGIRTLPAGDAMLFDAETFFVFEERGGPGTTQTRHSHSQRVVIVLNETQLLQRADDHEEIVVNEIADDVRFDAPMTHAVKVVGEKALRNIVIELKP